ncbi:GTPase-associated protein 1-related protein [Streptomyces lincolnensis]|uniref:GTPase-associated protein 1-related protein n=1 Tax=Streptomyces lincolnensis TaxID=1915 RepID=UPI0037D82898
MSPFHLHYTSAPPGPDGAGFRFTAVDDAVPRRLLGEIEQIIGYEAPRTAPRRPTDDELDAFPPAFTHTRLTDGSRLLCRSVYTGADHSGRYGNFHAHALWLPDGGVLPGGLLPVALWESPGWRTRTPREEEPADLPPGDAFEPAGLTAFARSRAARLPAFLADVREVLSRTDPPQVIVVEQDAYAVVQWVALAGAVVPRALAERLTFTSYTRRPDRARQHLVGVLPGTDLDPAHARGDPRFRVHNCTGGPSTPARPDPWATLAARVWLAGRPLLFEAAQTLPGGGAEGSFDAERLAATAAAQGLPLDSAARAAAAHWAVRHGAGCPEPFLTDLLTTVAAGGEPRTPEEWQALTRLVAHLPGLAEVRTADHLRRDLRATLLAAEGHTGPPASGDRQVWPAGGGEPASAADGRAVSPPRPPTADRRTPAVAGERDAERTLGLLALADALRVDTGPAHTALVRAAADAVLAGTRPVGLAEALRARPELSRETVEAVERSAAAGTDPVRLAAALRDLVPGADLARCPYLSMGELARRAGGRDRLHTFHELVATAGPDRLGDPGVLRAAHRLAWPDGAMTAAEAGHLAGELAPAWLTASGIGARLVATALHAPASDPTVPRVAADLLRHLPQDLAPRERGALQVLALAGRIADGSAEPGFTGTALAYCDIGRPLEADVAERIADSVARALLAERPPPGELDRLVASGDETLLDGYLRVGRSDAVRDRLRVSPAYTAACFVLWSGGAGLNSAWEHTRTTLLTEVLRPVVRAKTPQDIAETTRELQRSGPDRARAFEEWHRSGRQGRRGGGLFRRGPKRHEGDGS